MTTPSSAVSLHPVLHRALSDAVLINPGRVGQMEATLRHMAVTGDALTLLSASRMAGGDDPFWTRPDGSPHPFRPYVVHEGILQVPVQGFLLNRFPYAFGTWATGYDYIERAVRRGIEDGNVRGIALIVDSFGGEVAGCFECSDAIYAARSVKPVRGFATDYAFSAAYALISAASVISVTRSGATGSVGVVTMHADFSGALDQMGIKVTFVFAGKHKVDGNSYESLPEDVKGRIQERIDKLYGVFTQTVARNRNLEETDVRETEALTFDAEQSVERKFADRIGSLDDEMLVFHAAMAEQEDDEMTDKNTAEGSPKVFTQAEQDAAVASARAEGTKAGEIAAKTRISAILDSEEGKKRPKAALTMALKSVDTAEAVTSMLANFPEEAAPTAAAAPSGTPFDTAMGSTPNPAVGGSPTNDKPKDRVDGIFASAGHAPIPARAN